MRNNFLILNSELTTTLRCLLVLNLFEKKLYIYVKSNKIYFIQKYFMINIQLEI